MTSDDAASAHAQLHKEISQESWENRNRLRGYIYSQGYRDPDLSVLENDTQVRYYQARLKPNFVFSHGEPWPLLVQCFRYAHKEFHHKEGKQPRPEGHRKAWLLAFRDGKGPVEIARELGIDRGTAAEWRDRAQERLKSLPPDELDHLR
ncbi:hypothetical protein [Streptomyces sp. NPDC048192]|uniref:hypothetical protein n=1 Tax=Streptomyces sp. NPDC048192 TaxID=3365510 RepID=UPI003710D5EA